MCSNYISKHLNPPDLYGPLWTQTTLIFTLFLSSSLAASITHYLSAPGNEFDYDWQLLSVAMTLVYCYGTALPVALWIVLRYIGVGEWSVVEAIAIWGYSLFIWIPVSVRLTSHHLSRINAPPAIVCHPLTNRPNCLGRPCVWPVWLFPGCECLPNPGRCMSLPDSPAYYSNTF